MTAQLVRADNGYHLWSETYDRDLHDVFEVQDDIANAVVQALQIKLMGGELSRQKGGTQNLEAYQLYLRAMSARVPEHQVVAGRRRRIPGPSDQTRPELRHGVGGAGGDRLVEDGQMAWLDPTEGYERVRQLAQHALQLSPDLAEAHAALAVASIMTLDWDWAAAEAEGQRALAIDPTNPVR